MSDAKRNENKMPKYNDVKNQLETCMQIMQTYMEKEHYLGVVSTAQDIVKLSYLLSLMSKEFIWSNEEDDELYKNGVTVMWAVGKSKAIQKFIETLSYKVGRKCDWSYDGGRAHIDVPKECVDDATKLINDEEFMKQFIVPYSDVSVSNETYFDICH